jgi:hypothetical protein
LRSGCHPTDAHGAEIVHPSLERDVLRPVRESRAARVEHNQADLPREPVENRSDVWRQPERVEVGKMRRVDEVVGAVADDLVRDGDPTGSCVANVRHVHESKSRTAANGIRTQVRAGGVAKLASCRALTFSESRSSRASAVRELMPSFL